jgi:hypothetical protein
MPVSSPVEIERRSTLERIARWLNGGGRCLSITGMGGSGKTTLVVGLDEARLNELAGPPDGIDATLENGQRATREPWVVARHLCSVAVTESRVPSRAVERLAATLRSIDGYQEALANSSGGAINVVGLASGPGSRGVMIQSLALGEDDPAAFFLRAIATPLALLHGHGKLGPVLLVIDGVDEARQASGENPMIELVRAAATSELLPPQVRLLVTSRPDSLLSRAFEIGGNETIDLDRDAELDVRRFIDAVLLGGESPITMSSGLTAEHLAGRIANKAGSNFLVARAILDDLAARGTPVSEQSLQELPSALPEIYRTRLTNLDGAGRDARLTLLRVLSVARRPMTEHELGGVLDLADSLARERLADVLAFTRFDDAPPSRRSYRLFHATFGEFLADPDEAGEWWSEPALCHRLIGESLFGQGPQPNTPAWCEVDDYRLRYGPLHACLAAPESWSDVLRAKWLNAALERLGPSISIAALTELGDVDASPSLLPRVLLSALMALEVRAYAAYLAVRGVPSLLLRARGLERTLADLGALPPGDWQSGQPLVELATAFAHEGDEETLRALLAGLEKARRDDLVWYVSAELAGTSPQLALELIQAAHRHGPVVERICAGLASSDDYIEDAIAIAHSDERCRYAVARAVWPRDPLRALALLDGGTTVREEDPWGIDKGPTSPRERSLRLAEEGAEAQPDAALAVFEDALEVQALRERGRLGVMGVLASSDPERALELVSEFEDSPELPQGLWLALLAGIDEGVAQEMARRWAELHVRSDELAALLGRHVAFRADMSLAAVAPLERIRNMPTASRIALEALERFASAMIEQHVEVEHCDRFAGILGGAVALFDLQRGLELADRLRAELFRGVHRMEHRWLPLVRRMTPVDPRSAWEVCDLIQGEHGDQIALTEARRDIVQSIGLASPRLALELVFSANLSLDTRAALAGALSAVAPDIESHELLAALPRLGSGPDSAGRRKAVREALRDAPAVPAPPSAPMSAIERGGEVCSQEIFPGVAVDFPATLDLQTALRLCREFPEHTPILVGRLAEADREGALTLAASAGDLDDQSTLAVLEAVAAHDWPWAAENVDRVRWLRSEALAALARTLPAGEPQHAEACRVLARRLSGCPDCYTPRLLSIVEREGSIAPELAAAIVVAHMRQPLAYAQEDLAALVKVVAVATGIEALMPVAEAFDELGPEA